MQSDPSLRENKGRLHRDHGRAGHGCLECGGQTHKGCACVSDRSVRVAGPNKSFWVNDSGSYLRSRPSFNLLMSQYVRSGTLVRQVQLIFDIVIG